jgi:hypothetical protein
MKTKITLFVAVLAVALLGVGCASTEPAFVSDGLIAHYPFSGDAKDESGNGNDGEVKGPTLAVDRHGKPNSAYSFDGVDDFITTGGDGTSLALSERITISAWFASTGDDGWIISRMSDTQPAHQNYSLTIHNQKAAFWLNGLEMDDFRLDGNLDFRDGKWHQLVATWEKNGGVNNTKIYVDGSIDNSKTSPIDSLTTPIWKVQIGGGIEAFERNFLKGSIDDVRIYNRALSSVEVKALYDLEKPNTK